MIENAARLEVRDLSVRFHLAGRAVSAVTGANFTLRAGECLALVGESGCGKSVLVSTLLGLLPGNAQTRGGAWLRSPGDPDCEDSEDSEDTAVELLTATEKLLARQVRGRLAGLVPQSPAAHLTPVRTVRDQIEETVRVLCGRRAPARVGEVATRAGFPADHLDHYPHQLSGGLAQRAAFALALVGEPWLLLADEPTSGLDGELARQVVDELGRLRDAGHAILLVTHDLAAAERVADRVAVMYASRIVETAPADVFFAEHAADANSADSAGRADSLDAAGSTDPAGPAHPYARGLLRALPERGFTPIPGMSPELSDLPDGCAFHPRCPNGDEVCQTVPELETRGGSDDTARAHEVACHHA